MSIVFNSSTKTFYLDGKNTTYSFFINSRGYLEHLYYGEKIAHDPLSETRGGNFAVSGFTTYPGDDSSNSYNHTPSELCFFGNGDYKEPTVTVENDEGDMLTELLYDSHEILNEKPKISNMPSFYGGETLLIHLKDSVTNFCADLYYTVYSDCDVITRRIVYKNCRDKKVILRRAYSFNLPLESLDYDIITLHGAWGGERKIQKTPLSRGTFTIDSKRGSSSAILNPFMAICHKESTETQGSVYGISLVYSSSFALKAQGLPDGTAIITGGINDFEFSWNLNSNDYFETPEAVIAFSNEGLGGLSRTLHDAYRNHLINKRYVKSSRPILLNVWEGVKFNFDNEKLIKIADAIADTDIDTFVLDDGWFGKRDSDTSGLGDWFTNEKKMIGGLKAIIEHVNGLGMKFGLWFEPEMISEDSNIFRAHPDYAIGVPNRERCYARHQFVMDITRKDVRDYIVKSINDILRNNHIEYVKWDCNRSITEFFSNHLGKDRQGEFSHRYALGLYDLFERIVEANPDIFFEGCSSGGARFDLGILYYFPQIWASDNSDAEDRTLIQYGTSIAYPLSSMSCHITAVPNHQTARITPLKTREHIAHLGATGYEFDATQIKKDEINEINSQIKEYKNSEKLILEGDLYRIENPYRGNYFGFVIVSKDKKQAELTLYKRMERPNCEMKRIKLQGLDKNKKYLVREFDTILSGSTLMNVGFIPKFTRGDFNSLKFHFDEI